MHFKAFSLSRHKIIRSYFSRTIFGAAVFCVCFSAFANTIKEDFFTLQIAACPTVTEANQIILNLTEQGIPAIISENVMPNRPTMYRVRVGKFSDPNQARKQGELWRTRGIINEYWVAHEERTMTVRPRTVTIRTQSAAKATGTNTSSELKIELKAKNLPDIGLGELLSAVEGKWGVRIPEGMMLINAQIVFPKLGIVKPAVVMMDEIKSRALISPFNKSREFKHPMELRFEPGIKNSPGNYSLDFKQSRELLTSLRNISGFKDLDFDDHGFLLLGDRVEGGSEIARVLLRAAANSTEIIEIESLESSDIVVFGSTVTAEYTNSAKGRVSHNRIQLDFNDFKSLRGDIRSRIAFDPGFVFLHELTHGVWKLSDDNRFGGVGECEEYINQIRRELNLPERAHYHFKVRKVAPGSEEGELIFVQRSDSKSQKREVMKLTWDNTAVGSGSTTTPVVAKQK
jgi:SPOR domain